MTTLQTKPVATVFDFLLDALRAATDYNQEKADSDDEGEDEELKAGHAGAAAIFGEQGADVDFAAGDGSKNQKSKEKNQGEQAVVEREFELEDRIAADEHADDEDGGDGEDNADDEFGMFHGSLAEF